MIDSLDRQRLTDNWRRVVDEVDDATLRTGRSRDDVRIVGVTKYVDAELTAALVDVGCHDLGENRPQVLWEKAEKLAEQNIRWHLIGHLQRNKIRRTLQLPVLIHSVDSARLLDAICEDIGSQSIDNGSAADASLANVLLEVNISGDATKTGMTAPQIRELFGTLPRAHVSVQGLMAMAGWGTSPEEAQRQFAAVRELRDALATEFGIELRELSMGMSGDFVEAITEGATMVRIGSRLFEGLLAS